MKYSLIWLLSCILSLPLFATSSWECHVQDSAKQQWASTNFYQRVASSRAFEACKKQSNAPETCFATEESCELFINGSTTKPMWRCTALDQLSRPWRSSIYTHRDDAALAAKHKCHELSEMPDTCYINLMMCKNLNPNNEG
jgi:hypothetical protein